MTSDSSSGPANGRLSEVLIGDNRELQLLVARGLFPVPAEQLVPLQVALASGEDPEVAQEAAGALGQLDPRIAANVLKEGDSDEVMAFFARHASHPVILETVVRHRRVSQVLLRELAARLPPDLQEVLLLRQDALVEDPAILDRLEQNPELSTYARRRIGEYREHLLRRDELPSPPAGAGREGQEPGDADVLEALAEAGLRPAEGEVDDCTGLSEAQIRTLPVPVRLKLARGATRTLRSILVRDKNPMVARAVLYGNALSDSEVEQIATSRAVVEEVLEAIARTRQWIRKYGIMLAVVRNPRAPVGVAVRLVSRLSVRDLRTLGRDRNVADAVRSAAGRLYRIKRG